jgi:hypothetical protein
MSNCNLDQRSRIVWADPESEQGATMTTTIKRVPALVLATALVAIASLAALAATQAQAAVRHFDGTVRSKNVDARTFRIKTESGNRVSFHVNHATDFERLSGGFGGLHRGLRVEVDAKRTDNGLLAKQVEKHRSGGGDDHGGGHGGGNDDGPGHH